MNIRTEPLESRLLFAAAPSDVPRLPDVTASVDVLVFSGVQGTESTMQKVKVRNAGRATLTVSSIAVDGGDAAAFVVYAKRTAVTLRPGASVKLKVAFRPTGPAVFASDLRVVSDDPDAPTFSVPLRGLGTAGRFEAAEPSLQRILDAHQIPVNAGDADPATSRLDGPATSDEVVMPLMTRAGPGRVRVTTLAAYSWEWKPLVAKVGWYAPATPAKVRTAVAVKPGSAQTLSPRTSGKASFDPGDAPFGLFATWPSEQHGPTYSQDTLNPWDTSADCGRKVRFYPCRRPDGSAVPNTYVVAMEQAFNCDFQDVVLIVENVAPAIATT